MIGDERYCRQNLTINFGENCPFKNNHSHILVIGAGGVGSPAITYLVGAGISHITIVDFDTVAISNLHRQFLHTELGAKNEVNKAQSAKEFCNKYNSSVKVSTIEIKLTKNNIDEIIEKIKNEDKIDIVLDTSDNPECRFLMADFCYNNKLPLVHAAGIKWQSSVTTIIPESMVNFEIDNQDEKNEVEDKKCPIPCFRCLYNNPPPVALRMTAATVGIVGPTCGISGSIGASECLKILSLPRDKNGKFIDSYTKLCSNLLIGRLLMFSLDTVSTREIKYVRKAHCRCCGCKKTEFINIKK